MNDIKVEVSVPRADAQGGVVFIMDSERLGMWVRFRAFVVERSGVARIAEMDARTDDGKLAHVGMEEHQRVTGMILKFYHLWRRNECRNSPKPTAPC